MQIAILMIWPAPIYCLWEIKNENKWQWYYGAHCITLVLIWENAEEIAVPQVKPPTVGETTYSRWNYLRWWWN